jgi:hypothetical protein
MSGSVLAGPGKGGKRATQGDFLVSLCSFFPNSRSPNPFFSLLPPLPSLPSLLVATAAKQPQGAFIAAKSRFSIAVNIGKITGNNIHHK